MQITLNIDEATLQPAIKNHLESGQSVQSYLEQGVVLLTFIRSLGHKILLTGDMEKSYGTPRFSNLEVVDINRFLS